MVAAFRKDMDRSGEAFRRLVWPAVKSQCGGGDVRYTEGGSSETDRDLDILAGIDAYQILNGKIRGIASRIQQVTRSYDTFTIRYERHSNAGFETEYKKRLQAVRSRGEVLCAWLQTQAYVTNDWQSLLSVAVVRVPDLYEYIELERERSGGSFSHGRRNGIYLDTVKYDGAADFLVVPWERLRFAGVEIKIIRSTTPHHRPAANVFTDGVKRCKEWTATCLPCDSTWIGHPSMHVCSSQEGWRRDFWIRRIQWALIAKLSAHEKRDQAKLAAEAAAIVDKPLTRDRMVELLGARWSVEGDL